MKTAEVFRIGRNGSVERARAIKNGVMQMLTRRGYLAGNVGPSVQSLVQAPEGPAPFNPLDPFVMGYDRQFYQTLAGISQEIDVLDYSTGGSDSVRLPSDRVITGIVLVADPYQHDVSTADIVAVQDAVDRVINALTIVGGPTYFSLNSSLAQMKALRAMNKVWYPNVGHENLGLTVAVGVDQVSRQAWYIPFGFLNDYGPMDVSAGIPPGKEISLRATFGANNLIAVTAADGTVDPATDIYVVVIGVQGLPESYIARMPFPEFHHQHIDTGQVVTSSRFDLKPGLVYKRTTVLNLAVSASNNTPRNDTNVTDISVVFEKPTKQPLVDRMRWHVAKQALGLAFTRGGAIDASGTAALSPGGHVGVLPIDWRRITQNPMGLSTLGAGQRDVHIDMTMATTTGSIHLFHEAYNLPDPTVYEGWHPFRPQ